MHCELKALLLIVAFERAYGYIREDCYCGLANNEGRRITNGVMTKPFQYPWMVAIFTRHNKAYCGGSLISDKHVTVIVRINVGGLSICNPFSPKTAEYWETIYGKVKTYHLSQGEAIRFNRIFVHPNFKSRGSYDDYDVAILTFQHSVQFSRKLLPICVPQDRQNYGGKSGVISGWGTTDPRVMIMSPYLREGEVRILPANECPAATNLHNMYNFDSMLCGFNVNNVDTCQGDSGGPLFVETSPHSYEVIAVSSFGESCGGIRAGVYADITHSLPWVWSIINSTGICQRLKVQ